MIDPREEFKNIIRELAQEETRNILQNEDIYQNVMGVILEEKENNTYKVDIVTTILDNVLNQSGIRLKKGDSVLINMKYGSNYSNCYITAKAGTSLNTIDDTIDKEQELSSQLGGISFSIVENRLQVTTSDGTIRYINFD